MGDLARLAREARTALELCTSLRERLGESPVSGPGAALAGGLERAVLALQRALVEVEAALGEHSTAEPAAGPPRVEEQAAEVPAGPRSEEASSARPPEVEIAASLEEVARVIERDRLVVDPQDYRFAAKAAEILAAMPDAERSGEKGARVLVDCVRFLDALERDYPAPGYEGLAGAVRSAVTRLAEFLESSRGIELLPDPRGGESALAQAASIPGAKRIEFPSRRPKGEVLWLVKRGLRLGTRAEPPELVVSSGGSTAVFELVRDAALELLRPREQGNEARRAKAAAFKTIRTKLLPELAHSDADREATVLRYVANAMQPLNGDGALGDAISRIVSELEKRGFTRIPVRLGGPFDDSFSTSKFERRIVRSNAPKGTVVELIQIGFFNRDRVVAQKAVVGVSGGPEI